MCSRLRTLAPRWALAVMALALVLSPAAARLILHWEKALPWSFEDLRGFLSDSALGGLWAVGVALLSVRTRVGALLASVLWVVLTVVNYEHVRTFDAAVAPTYTRYLLDRTFLQGSALQLTQPLLLAVPLLALALSARWWGVFRLPRRVWLNAVAVALATAAVTTALPLHPHHLPWRQLHPLPLAARGSWQEQSPNALLPAPSLEQVGEVYREDLSGTSRLSPQGLRPNVLLVVVEGLSGGYLPSLARHQGVSSDIKAPLIDALGSLGLRYQNFIAPQRQTNRGLYALLCGDLPKLVSEEARMSEYARAGTRRCLPQILVEHGYRTTYLQASPLAFMMKDKFMKSAGFQQVQGTGSFPRANARSRWGIDDRAFLEQSLDRLKDLEGEEGPWFATLLTVGTHHPFIIPPGFRASGGAHAQAVAYADEAVNALVQGMEAAGLLENTLVLITADESAGLPRGSDPVRAFSQSWIPLLALGPGVPRGEVSEPFFQPDLALSVLDYLGLAGQERGLIGRSVFRRYPKNRVLYFGNTYLKRLYALEGDLLQSCSEAFEECNSQRVDPERPFGPSSQPAQWRTERLAGWRGVVERSRKPLVVDGPEKLRLIEREVVEVVGTDISIIFGGQYLTAAPGSRYEVDLDFEVLHADGYLELRQDIFTSGRVIHRPGISLLSTGDRARVRYDFVFKEGMPWVEVRLVGRPLLGARASLKFHRAQLTITPQVGDGTWEKVTPHRLEIERSASPGPLRFGLEHAALFSKGRCVKEAPKGGTLVGKDCRATHLLFGPYVGAEAETTVRATFEVEVKRGTALLRADVVSDLARVRHATSEQVRLEKGERGVVEVSFVTQKQAEALEARLESRPVGPSADVTIRALSFTLEPPPTLAAGGARL